MLESDADMNDAVWSLPTDGRQEVVNILFPSVDAVGRVLEMRDLRVDKDDVDVQVTPLEDLRIFVAAVQNEMPSSAISSHWDAILKLAEGSDVSCGIPLGITVAMPNGTPIIHATVIPKRRAHQ